MWLVEFLLVFCLGFWWIFVGLVVWKGFLGWFWYWDFGEFVRLGVLLVVSVCLIWRSCWLGWFVWCLVICFILWLCFFLVCLLVLCGGVVLGWYLVLVVFDGLVCYLDWVVFVWGIVGVRVLCSLVVRFVVLCGYVCVKLVGEFCFCFF